MGFKFLFLVFDATDLLERWVFELTPLALMGLPELQLALLSAVVAAANVFLRFSSLRRGQLLATIVTLIMIASLIAALRTSPYYFDAVNLPRFAVLAALLASIPLDHMHLLRRLGDSRERGDQTAPEAWDSPAPEVWDSPAPEVRDSPAPEVRDSPEPEVFDEAMSTLDETLDALDSAVTETKPDVKTDVTISLLEGLLSDFEATEEKLDSAETRRRQAIFEKRIRAIDERLATDAQDPDALFAKATHLTLQKEYERAMEVLDQLEAVNSDYPGLWVFKAKVFELMGNVKMAERSLERANE